MKKKQENIDEKLLLKIIEQKADKGERTLFNNWLEESADNAATFQQFEKIYNRISINPRTKQENWESVLQKMDNGVKVPDYIELPDTNPLPIPLWRNKLIRVAAMLLFVLGSWFLFEPIVFDSEQFTISGTDLNSNEPYQLADGSLVYLNGNSEITFSDEFGKKDRRLTLKGEAYFEVQRNENLPFNISANKSTIRVLGTSFNINSSHSDHVEVAVVSGEVAFFSDEENDLVNLKAGDLGTYDPQLERVKKDIIENQNFLSWKTGILYFDETPIADALAAIQQQYTKVLILEPQKGETTSTLTTTFDNQPLEAVLEELNLLLNVKYESRNDTIFFNYGD